MVGTRLIFRLSEGINTIRYYLWLYWTKQGVSGSGKTTLARALAETLTLPFIDADDLHPQTNKDKMSRGEPLTDADRMPWLVSVRRAAVEAIESNSGGEMLAVVVACSALKASYRDVLRGKHADIGAKRDGAPCGEAVTADGEKGDTGRLWVEEGRVVEHGGDVTLAWQEAPSRTYFVHPFGPPSILRERLTARKSHFMNANMLASQLDTLENPAEIGEEDVVEIRLEASPAEQVRAAIVGLRTVGAIP
jgi:gluconokinase